MYPLPLHTVELVLRYISPYTDPLPLHLISIPLRQRHHFLQIPTSSLSEYLCWPSPDNARTVELLDRLPFPSDLASYPICYTSDPESTFAHVQISSDAEGLRMLFHWDDGWKYHDLRLMPFPSPSFSNPQESLASTSADPPRPPSLDLVAEADHGSGSDDAYWDAYGATEHDLTFSPPRSESKSDAAEGEEAYWAQYASVQGSADSTLPSPLPINRKLRLVDPNGNESTVPFPPQIDPIVDVPVHAIHSQPLASKLGLPSPSMLAHLLSTLSPRKDTCSPVLDDLNSLQSPSAYSTDPSQEQTLADSELVTPPLPDGCSDPSIVSPVAVKANGVTLFKSRPRPLGETEDKALIDSIKGLYYLWRAGRKGESEEKDRNVFLRIAQAAIAYE